MHDALEPESGTADPGARASAELTPDAAPPMVPSRGAFLLAFSSVVIAGILGGIIGYGIADVTSPSDLSHLIGTLIGSIMGAAGVGIVAVLVLRAMSEWRRQQ